MTRALTVLLLLGLVAGLTVALARRPRTGQPATLDAPADGTAGGPRPARRPRPAVPVPRFTPTPTEGALLGLVPGAPPVGRPAVPGVELSPDQDRLVRDAFDVVAAELAEVRPLLLSGDRDGFRAQVKEILDRLWANLDATLGHDKAEEVQASIRANARPLPTGTP